MLNFGGYDMAYINIYMNNPTAAGTDGTVVSQSGAQTSPISVVLDKTKAETKAVKCAIRCDSGYKVSGNVTVSISGTTAAKWQLAVDNSYADAAAAIAGASWGDSITLSGVAATNTVFWAKAASTTDENPSKDTSVSIVAASVVEAV